MVSKVTINDKFYDMPAKEAAKELGLNYSTLMSRVRSKSKKWEKWKFSELSFSVSINNKHYDDLDEAIFALLDIKKRISRANKLNL